MARSQLKIMFRNFQSLAVAALAFFLVFPAGLIGQSVPERPSAPYLLVPETATWHVKTAKGKKPKSAAKAPSVSGIEVWMRGPDLKQVTTYSNGLTKIFLKLQGMAIDSDSTKKVASLFDLSTLTAEGVNEETKFSSGYANPFAMLAWASEKTFVRLDTYNGIPVYVYEKPLVPTPLPDGVEAPPQPPEKWTLSVDAKTGLPVVCSFGPRLYEFVNLQANIPIPDEVFAIPENAKASWEEHQKEIAHEKNLHQINSRKP
jgi:hypothetical protein